MKTKIVEVTNGVQNWGKIMLMQLTHEATYESKVAEGEHLFSAMPPGKTERWAPTDVIVFDLQTCEGARFRPSPQYDARAELALHKIWVCPMFEPFLVWLFQQPDPFAIPAVVDLPEAAFAFAGHRREGVGR